MPAARPTIVRVDANGKQTVTTVAGSDSARPALSLTDILAGTNLLATLNLLQTDVGLQAQALSTGETDATYFEDIVVDSTGKPFALTHNKNRRVRWQVVDWTPTTTGQQPMLERDKSQAQMATLDTLVLRSYRAGIVTIRVW